MYSWGVAGNLIASRPGKTDWRSVFIKSVTEVRTLRKGQEFLGGRKTTKAYEGDLAGFVVDRAVATNANMGV